MNAAEIIKLLKSPLPKSNRNYSDTVFEALRDESDVSLEDGRGLKHIMTKGGGEGDGEEYFIVFALVINAEIQSYWKIPGWYQSYQGGELTVEDTFEVRPVQRTVTFYE